jgi:hypothetical protein
MEYAYRGVLEHLSEAKPSADLREALLNTHYIASLIKLGLHEPWQIYSLVDFLTFLRSSVGYELPRADITSPLPDFLLSEIRRYRHSLSPSP